MKRFMSGNEFGFTGSFIIQVHLLVARLKGIWLPLETQQMHGFTGIHPSRHLIFFFVHFQGHKQLFHCTMLCQNCLRSSHAIRNYSETNKIVLLMIVISVYNSFIPTMIYLDG